MWDACTIPLLENSLLKNSSLFHQDVAQELTVELPGKPDFIIGNYTDGNLVASLLCHQLGVTQVCEKTTSFQCSSQIRIIFNNFYWNLENFSSAKLVFLTRSVLCGYLVQHSTRA